MSNDPHPDDHDPRPEALRDPTLRWVSGDDYTAKHRREEVTQAIYVVNPALNPKGEWQGPPANEEEEWQ